MLLLKAKHLMNFVLRKKGKNEDEGQWPTMLTIKILIHSLIANLCPFLIGVHSYTAWTTNDSVELLSSSSYWSSMLNFGVSYMSRSLAYIAIDSDASVQLRMGLKAERER